MIIVLLLYIDEAKLTIIKYERPMIVHALWSSIP